MNRLEFSWGPEKAKSNQKKHGVSFDEAKTVFYDENARLINDPDHSEYEHRFVLLGLSLKPRLLTVCHCYKFADSAIRIISARKANQNGTQGLWRCIIMRKEYDFSKSKKNPYAKMLKKQITIRIEEETIDYFKELAAESGIPYQNLMNMFLRDCANTHKRPILKWA